MEMNEVVRRLKQIGCNIARTQINSRGRPVHLVKHVSGWNVAMFQEDAADLASQRATINAIIARNEGADLADPWPVEESSVE
jgi:glycine cleavage system regulatory protein